MNPFLKKQHAWLATALTLVTTGCSTESNQPHSEQNADKNNADWAASSSSTSPAGDQNSHWSLNEYVKRYESSVGEPEKVQILQNDTGEKYLLMDFPSDSLKPDGTHDTVKVYKQLDGNRSEKATEENQSRYHGTGSYVMYYRYYPYYTSANYSAYDGYHGYYTPTDRSTRIHTPSERAFHHNNNMHTGTKSVARFNPRAGANAGHFSSRSGSFRAGAASLTHSRSNVGTTRGVFGRSAMRAGSFRAGG